FMFSFESSAPLPLLHSFPTRRSSDLNSRWPKLVPGRLEFCSQRSFGAFTRVTPGTASVTGWRQFGFHCSSSAFVLVVRERTPKASDSGQPQFCFHCSSDAFT